MSTQIASQRETRSASDVIRRLCEALDARTDEELARLLVKGRTTISSWRQRNSVPYEECVEVAERHGFSLDWLLTGNGPKWRESLRQGMIAEVEGAYDNVRAALDDYVSVADHDAEHDRATELADGAGAGVELLRTLAYGSAPSGPLTPCIGGEFVMVPRYNVEASAGSGRLVQSEQIVDHLAFRHDWIARHVHAPPESLLLVSAAGDSMEPRIEHGDLLLVDRSDTRLSDGAVYVLVVGEHLVVKAAELLMDGGVRLLSDNPAYAPQTIAAGDVESLHVLGRVVWFGRSL